MLAFLSRTGLGFLLVWFSCSLSVQALAFNYGTTKIRGVSLGGWILLEPFLTPDIFEATGDPAVVDEYTYGQKYGSVAAGARLKSHWDTFITENDIALIKSYGLNHVRIPIGYWSLNKNSTEPYPVGAYPYVKKAVSWCQKYGLKVILDLHGAPGSQNGFDNSGRKGPIAWHTSKVNVDRTRAALKILIDDFVVNPTYQDTVTSIQPINEPAGFIGDSMLSVAKQFYYDSYGALRWPYGTSKQAGTLLSLHDAFQDPAVYWQNFMPGPNWYNVALDTHYYSIFDAGQLRWTNQQRIDGICNFAKSMTGGSLWTFAGEWTPAITDCAGSKTVLGPKGSSMYDGTAAGSTAIGSCTNMTGSAANFSNEMKTFMRQYWETQVNVFERGQGWIQWTWKTSRPDEWSYMKGVEYGWIPKNPAERKYPDYCQTKLPVVPTTTTKTTSTISTSTTTSTIATSTTTSSSMMTTSSTITSKGSTSSTSTTSKPSSTTKPTSTSASTSKPATITTSKITTTTTSKPLSTSKITTTSKVTTTSKPASTSSISTSVPTSPTSAATISTSSTAGGTSTVALAKGRGQVLIPSTTSKSASTPPPTLAKIRGRR